MGPAKDGSRNVRAGARVWTVLVGIPALVLATLWVLYAWSVRIDTQLLADLRETARSLTPGADWWALRVPREGALRICLYRLGDAPARACVCVTEPARSGGQASVERSAATRDAVAGVLADAREHAAGCERLVIDTRRFVRYQRLEARLAGGRVREISPIVPGER